MSEPLKSFLVSQPELWAGVECSVNRIGDKFCDQLERSGHAQRPGDLELFAELGVRRLRYPVLWERTAPDGLENADWSWAKERLTRLRELGISPIVGLVHHGSGPLCTSLVDEKFPERLVAYARAVAEKFPWVTDYTPVNEPLTTARFSCLYGHWYPHERDALKFARAMLNQCRAIVLSMRAVREINSGARLIQTEDLGRTHSTPALSYQADFENERRWLTFDLLAGRVDSNHSMWHYLRWVGVQEHELQWFLENACAPDVIGINHYLTSERFLDERLSRYPASTHGGNGRHDYADVEAVRVLAEGTAGPKALMRETWERYSLPLAVTEAHLGCWREEQLRWFKEVWDGAKSLREEGARVVAVTAWSLLGSFDWNSLLTREDNHYEPGVFDLRARAPRPTALAHMLRDLAFGGEHKHAALDTPGWWRRLERLHYLPVCVSRHHDEVAMTMRGVNMKGAAPRPILIAGATGTLGRAFARICEMRGLSYRLLTRSEMDIADGFSVEKALREYEPWAVVNAAGYVRVDDAESERERCFRENSLGPKLLASMCARRSIALVTFSSDLVFDGRKPTPYIESDEPSPLNVYGYSKLEAEREARELHPRSLVIRTSAFFGPWDEYNFVTLLLRALASGRRFRAACDAVISPTYVPDLVHSTLDLLIDGESGVWHLANAGALSWDEFARIAARMAGLDDGMIDACPTQSLNLVAPRPSFTPLASERGQLMQHVENALACYMRDCGVNWQEEVEKQSCAAPIAIGASNSSA